MKKVGMLIASLIVISALKSSAEVKPNGTVLPYRCSDAVEMYNINPAVLIAPVSSVCFASVVGMGQQSFMMIDKEIFSFAKSGVNYKLTLVGEVGSYGQFVSKNSRVKVEMQGLEDRTGLTLIGKYYSLRIASKTWQHVFHTMSMN